jgi:DNA-binding transcriptional regulator YhcF (GntR family)
VEVHVNKASEVPVRQQVAEQILALIVTGRLKAGSPLPSVRELARRLKIHHNTVSEAYQDLVRRQWLVRRPGSHLIVRGAHEGMPLKGTLSLDDIINQTIRLAREQGYTLQELRRKVREILSAEPPDHILVVAEESGLRRLLEMEVQQALGWPVEGCSEKELALGRGLEIGALVATPVFSLLEVEPLVTKERPPVPLEFGTPDHLIEEVSKLSEPSVIAIVSVSKVCLRAAAGLLAPTTCDRHSMVEYLWPLEEMRALEGADLVLCDSLVKPEVRRKRCVAYHLVDENSMKYLGAAMDSYQDR